MTQDTNGRLKVEKKGLKEITREGFEYELTLSFDIAQNHLATTSKDRTSLFMDKPDFRITKETGETLSEWAEKGVVPEVKEVKTVEQEEQVPAQEQATTTVSGKCEHCGTTNKYHRKGCPNA